VGNANVDEHLLDALGLQPAQGRLDEPSIEEPSRTAVPLPNERFPLPQIYVFAISCPTSLVPSKANVPA
jgi:hypothetical protein